LVAWDFRRNRARNPSIGFLGHFDGFTLDPNYDPDSRDRVVFATLAALSMIEVFQLTLGTGARSHRNAEKCAFEDTRWHRTQNADWRTIMISRQAFRSQWELCVFDAKYLLTYLST
jgi:hypothetical protein